MNSPANLSEAVIQLSQEGVRLLQTNRIDEAGQLLRQALEQARKSCGETHPVTADCLNNLGEWHRLQRQGDKAEECYRQALAIRKEVSGLDSAEAGPVLNNLALLLRQAGRLDEAEPLYRRVLAIFERTHGPGSVQVAGVVNNLAQIFAHTGRPAEAEAHMRRAIGLFETAFGASHPNVAVVLNNLARLLARLDRERDAEPPARRQVEIFEEFFRTTGDQHTHQMSARKHYFELLVESLGFRSRTAHLRLRALVEGKDPGELPAADPTPAEQPDFDALSRAANAPDADMAAKGELYAAAFRLPQWHFIARGTFPDVQPYVAANRALVDGVPMLKAFTDPSRLQTFARDNDLAAPSGEVLILSLPVETIQPTLEGLAAQGVTHVHFNADDCSDGFYAPLRQLPAIRQHLEAAGQL